MSVILAFTTEHAARVTGITEERIRYWDGTRVISPSIHSGQPHTPFNRLYSFRDLVGIRTISQLRDTFNVPLQRLRRLGHRLAEEHDAPWSSLKFLVAGNHLYFRDPHSKLMLSAIEPGQIALVELLDLEEIAQHMESQVNVLNQRNEADFGQVVQHRYVRRNQPVLAGTRIPTSTIWEFHLAGYGTDEILEEYPRLTALDVEGAIRYEQARHQKQAS